VLAVVVSAGLGIMILGVAAIWADAQEVIAELLAPADPTGIIRYSNPLSSKRILTFFPFGVGQ